MIEKIRQIDRGILSSSRLLWRLFVLKFQAKADDSNSSFTIYYFTGNEEPTPGMSYIEFDINKHTTDLLGLYRYVAAKVHRHHFVGGWADLEIPR